MIDPGRTRRIPDEKRELFREPFGTPIEENDLTKLNKNNKLITVGDVVSLTVNRNGIVPDIAVYDGMTERREMTEFAAFVEDKGWRTCDVINPAGTITAELANAVRNALSGSGKKVIRVIGEEDLAALPCILSAPNGTNIIYGWPGKGMMLIVNDDDIKKRAEALIKEMETDP
jgi:uncharacterized protein (UPF0218 family)